MTATVTALLTPRQKQILAFIRGHYTEHGFSPSMREIGAHVGLTSTSSVLYQLDQLVLAGCIRRAPGLPRALVVLDPATGGQ